MTGVGRAARAVFRRPSLWATALGQLVVLAQPGWWRHWPPLPVPDREYLRFRMQTMYGDPEHEAEPDDLIAYLHWCRGMRRLAR